MSASFEDALPGLTGLAVLLVLAVGLTVARPRITPDPAARRGLARLALFAVVGQALHFAEELATGFATAFPRTLGLEPWPTGFFVTFNMGWLVIWSLAVPALRAGWTIALVPIWFLGLALVANGVVHPLLALHTGGYFPGLATAPLIAVVGVLLVRELWVQTARWP